MSVTLFQGGEEIHPLGDHCRGKPGGLLEIEYDREESFLEKLEEILEDEL